MSLIFFGLIIMVGLLIVRPTGITPIDYTELPTLFTTTLDKYLGRVGSKFKLINEVISRDQLPARFFRRARMDEEGGVLIKFPLQFARSEVTEWSHPGTKGTLKGTKAPTWGSVPRRFLAWFWYKSDIEINLNKGAEVVLLDLMKLAKQDVAVDIIERLGDALLAVDGNYAHDGEASNFLIPFGVKYWGTIDGLHVTGDTTKLVGGINPYTQPLWRNPYVNPVAASDGYAPIKSIYELRMALDRMFEEMHFDSIEDWGSLKDGIPDHPTWDPDSPESRKDLFIWADKGSSIKFKDVLFDREDNVGYDQGRPRPVYKGVEVFSSRKLGMNAYGYGKDENNNELWVDRGGDYASGQWAGYGEMIVGNMKYLHVVTHPDFAPNLKPAYRPEGMFGLAHEGQFSIQTMCRSRRRGIGYIGPYPLDMT